MPRACRSCPGSRAGTATRRPARSVTRCGSRSSARARAYVYPARHYASNSTDPSLPPMGLRVRLKASVDISHLPRQARIVAQAMKTYGMILADNGSNWYVSGAPSPHWSNDQLHALGALHGSDFEVVDTVRPAAVASP